MQRLFRTISSVLLAASLMTPGLTSAAGGFMPYGDISRHWAKASIIRGVQAGLFAAGSKAPLFYPNRAMTRAEFVALIDRLYNGGQFQLYPLTFLSEHADLNRGEGFDEPYLPYKDVDRLTWMYAPTLRVSYLMDRLYGPNAIQQVFPGELMKPNQPITQEEAAKLLQMFTMTGDSGQAWEEVKGWGWLDGERTDLLKRGEAAVAADRLMNYLMQDTILPLLDYDGQKFPMVPEIQELFPLFVTYTDPKTADEQTYVDAVEAIRNHEDTDETYSKLTKLAENSFSNQIGVHFYLSWDPSTPLEANLDEAFRAIDAYFQDKVVLPDTLRLLAANVYDIALQMGANDPDEYETILQRLSAYEQKLKRETKEWESLSIYLGALEVKAGHTEKALERYQSFASRHPEALLNSVYYLVQEGRTEDAQNLLVKQKPKVSDERMVQLVKLLAKDLQSLQQQSSIATDLAFTLRRLDHASSYQVKGEALLSGYAFKYAQDVDAQRNTSHTIGFYQSPQQLVSDKLETYTDGQKMLQYNYDSDKQGWYASKTGVIDYLHEWVGTKSIQERLRELGARYYKQSFGRYDIITEWIPSQSLEAKAKSVSLGRGKIKNVPLYMNKYYIDRESDELIEHVWRYEELYESGEYVAFSGTDHYDLSANVKVFIPGSVRKEVTR
ncbi:S-layer homology domain-containing protein [Brevibacillus sp. GCM10020057]|uniref:S-layer homology domain-containing protein n=1 Tax=Brevibacillus sp. GCM10020057 TaxID=3317327 RepID=UPI003632A012